MDPLRPGHALPVTLLRYLSSSTFGVLVSEVSQEVLDDKQTLAENVSKADILTDLLLYNDANHLQYRDQGFRALTTLARKLLHSRSQDEEIDGVRKVVDLCAKYEPLLDALIEDCILNLHAQVQVLAVERGPSNVDDDCFSNVYQHIPFKTRERENHQVHIMVDASLAFIKMAAWYGLLQSRFDIEPTIQMLMILVGHKSFSISTQSKNAVCATFSSHSKENPLILHAPSTAAPVSLFQWTRIVELTDDSFPPHCRGGAYTVWLHALLAFQASLPTIDQQQDTRYWKILHRGLAEGTTEQQKVCLAIAKLSTMRTEQRISNEYHRHECEKAEDYNTRFAKFCTIYETVSSRYLNQVQECLPDLSVLTKSTINIHKAWLVALITSALGPRNQESIKGLIGNWTMRHIPEILTQCVSISPRFLKQSFLPWATAGYHFTTSVTETKTNVPICLHGEAIVTCIRDLIKAADSDGGLAFARAVIDFLDHQAGKIFPSARVYTLEGVRRGLEDQPISLNSYDMDKLVRIAYKSGFQDVMHDFMVFQCACVAVHVTCGAEDPRYDATINANTMFFINNHRYSQLQDVARLLRERPSQKSALQYESTAISDFGSLSVSQRNPSSTATEGTPASLEDGSSLFERLLSRFTSGSGPSLKGRGLPAACSDLLFALETTSTESLNSILLAKALDAIWDEFEVQDYPKQIAMRLPALILHLRCVKQCRPGSQLSRSLCEIIPKLQKVGTNRVYAFAPFAVALRKCVLHSPQSSQLPIVDAFVNFANDPPSTRVEFKLASAVAAMFSRDIPFRNYEFYFGKSAGYGYASVFDTLNRWPDTLVEVACRILDGVLHQWLNQRPPVPVYSKWKATIQLQMVLILMQKVIGSISSREVDDYLHKLYYILSIEPLPRYRYLLEWTILRIYVHVPRRRGHVLSLLNKPDLSNPKHVVSIMKIATMIALLPDIGEDFAYECMLQLNISAASPKIVLRHEAQWSFPLLWTRATVRGWSLILNNACFSRFNEFVLGLPTYEHPPKGRLLEKFDPVEDHNLTHLVSGGYLSIEPGEDARLHRDDFIELWEDVTVSNNDDMIMPLGAAPSPEDSWDQEPTGADDLIEASERETNSMSTPLQIKANPLHVEALTMDVQSRRSTSVIVVASLIESAYNLGGITRACEILGASALYMRNSSSVLKDRAFSTLSVSSECWLPIRDLDPAGIPAFLNEQKREGFEAVGIEQTDSSKTLGDKEAVFEEKTVLVLGGEREGIPARILGECDWCVEIKQIGITRSLNVQTAAACVLFEYVRQRKPTQP